MIVIQEIIYLWNFLKKNLIFQIITPNNFAFVLVKLFMKE